MMIIRQETKQDYKRVYTLVQDAFATAEHSDGDEQDLVVRLRGSNSFIPALSLVAEQDGRIVGHILYTKASLGDTPAVLLAPLAVDPSCQKQGVGTLLLCEGHRIAAALGYEVCLLVGSERYYPRAGYRPASEFGIVCPFEGIPDQNFMALPLRENAVVHYPYRLNYAKEYF